MIKDYGRGLIIGDSSTFGKGTVQSIVQIDDHSRRRDRKNQGALKLTIQQFYRANGDSTQIKGVPPDIHIPSIRDTGPRRRQDGQRPEVRESPICPTTITTRSRQSW